MVRLYEFDTVNDEGFSFSGTGTTNGWVAPTTIDEPSLLQPVPLPLVS